MTLPRMVRIDTPHWARPFLEQVDEGFDEQVHARIRRDWAQLQATVHGLVGDHVDEVSEEDGFPTRSRLTGQYYLSGGCFLVHDRGGQAGAVYGVSVLARCLEHPFVAGQVDLDYLGLEFHFLWNPDQQRLEPTGDIDSSVI